ncbi:MAG: FliH/SctL family protein [Clostridia bacterium]
MSRIIKAQELRGNPTLVGNGQLETLLAALPEAALSTRGGARKSREAGADPAALARSLIEQAERAAKARLDEATQESARILKEAYDKGYEDGRAEATARVMERAKEFLEYLESLVRGVAETAENAVRAAEDTVALLAIEVAEKILRHEVSIDGSVVLEMVRESVEKAKAGGSIKIRVSAWDLDRVKDFRDELIKIADDVESIEIIEDPRVEPGGCIVDTEFGSVDARLGTQLREIRRAFFGNGDGNVS